MAGLLGRACFSGWWWWKENLIKTQSNLHWNSMKLTSRLCTINNKITSIYGALLHHMLTFSSNPYPHFTEEFPPKNVSMSTPSPVWIMKSTVLTSKWYFCPCHNQLKRLLNHPARDQGQNHFKGGAGQVLLNHSFVS